MRLEIIARAGAGGLFGGSLLPPLEHKIIVDPGADRVDPVEADEGMKLGVRQQPQRRLGDEPIHQLDQRAAQPNKGFRQSHALAPRISRYFCGSRSILKKFPRRR